MTSKLRAKMFGHFEAWLDDTQIPNKAWPQRKTQMLLKIFLSQRGQVFTQDQLLDMLYPDQDMDAASKNLRKRMSELRRILEPNRKQGAQSQFIKRVGDGYVLPKEVPCWIDTETFYTSQSAAADAQSVGDWEGALASYLQAEDLYRSDFLSEDLYEEWTIQPREYWREKYITGLEGLSESYARLGQYTNAIEFSQRALTLDALRESFYRQLMIFYWRQGEKSKVSQIYEACVEALSAIGVEPSAETTGLHKSILNGDVIELETIYPPHQIINTSPAPSHAPEVSRDEVILSPSSHHNLPFQMNRFIGRAEDITQVKQRLKQTYLLTLTAIGGAGKTRLSLQVGADLVDDFNDGVWFVELANLSNSDLICQIIAEAVDVIEVAGVYQEDTLIKALKHKHLLLIIDNCEHLLSTCAQLVQRLLMNCTKLKILATSREPLNIPGELTWPVRPLSNPDPTKFKTVDPVENIVESEAGQLFIERAQAIQPMFKPTSDNAAAIASICLQLDGIPLAIELAAARIKMFSPQKLLERLGDRFQLLTSGYRNVTTRQQTLQATIDWSYDLLSVPEKKLLARLSVFNGGWLLEAAEAICSSDHQDGLEVINGLTGLVQKSLVEAEEHEDIFQYRLLETVRQYGQRKLADSREEPFYREAHAAYYLKLAEASEIALRGETQAEWMRCLKVEHDNLRASLEWFLEAGTADEALKMSGALGRFWTMQGHFSEGRQWQELALKQHKDAFPNARAVTLGWGGVLAWQQGALDSAEASLQESLKIFRQINNPLRVAMTLSDMGLVARDKGNFEQAIQLFKESLASLANVEDEWHKGTVLSNLGDMARNQNNLQAARTYLEEGLTISRKLNSRQNTAMLLNRLGMVFHQEGKLEQAQETLHESLGLCREIADRRTIAVVHGNLGNVARDMGNLSQAREHFQQSLNFYLESGATFNLGQILYRLSKVAQLRNKYTPAAQLQGVVSVMLLEIGASFEPYEQNLFEQTVLLLTDTLGKDGYEQAFEEGKNLSTTEAIELALQVSKE